MVAAVAHPYLPAQHWSRASAHPDPDPLLLSFCFYGRQEYQSTQTSTGPFSTSSLRPEAIKAPNFESHAACRHDRFLHRDWAGWQNPGDHSWLFGCPLKALHPSFFPFPSKLEQCSQQLHVLLPKVSLMTHFFSHNVTNYVLCSLLQLCLFHSSSSSPLCLSCSCSLLHPLAKHKLILMPNAKRQI